MTLQFGCLFQHCLQTPQSLCCTVNIRWKSKVKGDNLRMMFIEEFQRNINAFSKQNFEVLTQAPLQLFPDLLIVINDQ